jgi:hypothetical protein
VADLIGRANRDYRRLPLSRGPRVKIGPDLLFIHVWLRDLETLCSDQPIVVAVTTSLDMSLFNAQIRYSTGLYLSSYQEDLFINQLSNMRAHGQSNQEFARGQVWMKWNAMDGRYDLRTSGASEALIRKIFDTREEIGIYRVGYPEELQLFNDLRDPARRRGASRELSFHLDVGNSRNQTHYGPGRVHGYYFTSDGQRVQYHTRKAGTTLYRVRVQRADMLRLARAGKIFAGLEWADEINFFSLEALAYLGDRCEILT